MDSLLLHLPAELRLMIYGHLFDAGRSEGRTNGNSEVRKPVYICNGRTPVAKDHGLRRKTYYVLCRFHIWQNRYYETTYYLSRHETPSPERKERRSTPEPYFCVPLMGVCRQIYAETANMLYGGHVFDFGADVEAVPAFLGDLTPATKALVTRIAVTKAGACAAMDSESVRAEWRAMCKYLRDSSSVTSLRLTVHVGRPPASASASADYDPDPDISPRPSWEGPRRLSRGELDLLLALRVDCLLWIEDLASVKNLRSIRVLAESVYMPPPGASTVMLTYAAFSGALDSGAFTELLEERMRLSPGSVELVG